jgi:hypothetical protein
MIEKLTKGISALVPFLAAYPAWVKAMFSAWVLLSAALLLALLLARGPNAQASNAQDSSNDAEASGEPLWLSIDGVDLFGKIDSGKVKVTAKVNGIEYQYPSLEGIEWMEVGPTMSSQQFRVPRANGGYNIRFTMVVRHEGNDIKMVSQRTEHFNTAPFNGRYRLYRIGEENTRGATVEAEIEYSVRE